MEALRLGKPVKSIIQLERDASGDVVPVILYRERKKKRRGTRGIRSADSILRRMARAQRDALDTYLSRHDRSNQKRRDGWVRDLPLNLTRAGRSGAKQMRKVRWINI